MIESIDSELISFETSHLTLADFKLSIPSIVDNLYISYCLTTDEWKHFLIQVWFSSILEWMHSGFSNAYFILSWKPALTLIDSSNPFCFCPKCFSFGQNWFSKSSFNAHCIDCITFFVFIDSLLCLFGTFAKVIHRRWAFLSLIIWWKTDENGWDPLPIHLS